MKRNSLITIFSSTAIIIIVLSTSLYFTLKPPDSTDITYEEWIIDYEGIPIITGSAALTLLENPVKTDFGTYPSEILDYTPSIIPAKIEADLSNVNMQGLTVSEEIRESLAEYGFAITPSTYKDIYGVYGDEEEPLFITSDLCLHAFHKLFDLCLRILEMDNFYDDFENLLFILREDQINQNLTVTEGIIHSALNNNIAYLSVMLKLLNSTNKAPVEVEEIVNEELLKINSSSLASSSIFGYIEDYSQYTVRGHYTRTEKLSAFFRAMMYAGRMSFNFSSIEHSRMTLLLISSFNETSIFPRTALDYWKGIYETTSFLVSSSDDITVEECFDVWDNLGKPVGDTLVNDALVNQFRSEVELLRDPRINSMFVWEGMKIPKGFRFMGQRFVPDSYIFQELVHDKVSNRFIPNALDILSILGSSRADFFMQNESEIYPEYDDQILALRTEFGNLTEYDWAQSTYWLWLYTLFPLLEPAFEGYPGFMRNIPWEDKSLITTLGSWAELRHDTILYAKPTYSLVPGIPEMSKGYVEPYPDVYSRLANLVEMLKDGLQAKNFLNSTIYTQMDSLIGYFERLTDISIRELENTALTESDYLFLSDLGTNLYELLEIYDGSEYVNPTDDRTAVIADVVTSIYTDSVLEVGVGNPFLIYVIVQDEEGNLRLTKGGTFSYYEFTVPISSRLTDEAWHEILDTNPPPLPDWVTDIPTFKEQVQIEILIFYRRKHYF